MASKALIGVTRIGTNILQPGKLFDTVNDADTISRIEAAGGKLALNTGSIAVASEAARAMVRSGDAEQAGVVMAQAYSASLPGPAGADGAPGAPGSNGPSGYAGRGAGDLTIASPAWTPMKDANTGTDLGVALTVEEAGFIMMWFWASITDDLGEATGAFWFTLNGGRIGGPPAASITCTTPATPGKIAAVAMCLRIPITAGVHTIGVDWGGETGPVISCIANGLMAAYFKA
jgi:hypothetical protein